MKGEGHMLSILQLTSKCVEVKLDDRRRQKFDTVISDVQFT